MQGNAYTPGSPPRAQLMQAKATLAAELKVLTLVKCEAEPTSKELASIKTLPVAFHFVLQNGPSKAYEPLWLDCDRIGSLYFRYSAYYCCFHFILRVVLSKGTSANAYYFDWLFALAFRTNVSLGISLIGLCKLDKVLPLCKKKVSPFRTFPLLPK